MKHSGRHETRSFSYRMHAPEPLPGRWGKLMEKEIQILKEAFRLAAQPHDGEPVRGLASDLRKLDNLLHNYPRSEAEELRKKYARKPAQVIHELRDAVANPAQQYDHRGHRLTYDERRSIKASFRAVKLNRYGHNMELALDGWMRNLDRLLYRMNGKEADKLRESFAEDPLRAIEALTEALNEDLPLGKGGSRKKSTGIHYREAHGHVSDNNNWTYIIPHGNGPRSR